MRATWAADAAWRTAWPKVCVFSFEVTQDATPTLSARIPTCELVQAGKGTRYFLYDGQSAGVDPDKRGARRRSKYYGHSMGTHAKFFLCFVE